MELIMNKTKLEELFDEGRLVHIFAGRESGQEILQEEGESASDAISRAAKLSENGDVWLTPHW